MKKFWNTLGPNGLFFLMTLCVGILYSSVSVIAPTVSGEMVTEILSSSSHKVNMLVLYLLLSLIQIILSQVDTFATDKFKIRQKKHLRFCSFRAYSYNGQAGREEISKFVSFINNDIPSLVEQYFAGYIDIIKCITMLVFTTISLLYIHWLMATIVLGVSVLIVLVPKWLGKKDGQVREEFSKSLGRYNAILQSFLSGIRVLKTYLYHARSSELLDTENRNVEKTESAVMIRRLLVYSITGMLQVSKTVLIFVVGLYLIGCNEISIGGLIAVIQLAAIISSPIEVLAYLFHAKNEVLPMLNRYQNLASSYSENMLGIGASAGKAQTITVSHLSYSVGTIDLLRDISVTFEAGGKYIITGESGSGKSTFLRLLSRVGEDNYEGKIFLNSTDISDICLRNYYTEICPVFQEPYIFLASLEENICLGRQISKYLYKDVITKLNLGYLLERYKGQEITPEIMEKLSGGEKQRVALARAMVGRPSVYLLDEITSALDPANAEIIERAILDEDATIICVSHRLRPEWMEQYDQKIELNGGKMIIS